MQLRGSIPASMERLTRLEMLHLQHNKLDGDLPAELAYMESMKHLKLGANDLRGEIFELDRMTNLRCVAPRRSFACRIGTTLFVATDGSTLFCSGLSHWSTIA